MKNKKKAERYTTQKAGFSIGEKQKYEKKIVGKWSGKENDNDDERKKKEWKWLNVINEKANLKIK